MKKYTYFFKDVVDRTNMSSTVQERICFQFFKGGKQGRHAPNEGQPQDEDDQRQWPM